MSKGNVDSLTRICTMSDCVRFVRARGLCSSHYNQQHQPNRHIKIMVACSCCGVMCEKDVANTRVDRFCSWSCRRIWQGEEARKRHMLPVRWVRPKRQITQPVAKQVTRVWISGPCRVCSVVFTSIRWGDATRHACSAECVEIKRCDDRRQAKNKRRALKLGAFVAPVFRLRIFERDGWRCQLCKRKVKRKAVAPHPRSPTLDHIIPLARGGKHEPANVQTACFLCNARKGDRYMPNGEQLALIG